jgi:hypothetical protein
MFDKSVALLMLCCVVPVLFVVGFVGWTVVFNETWNNFLDRWFPGRPRLPPSRRR